MMINWTVVILCAVGISILLSFIVVPRIIYISIEKKLFDRPGSRKIHSGNVSRLGGFAFLPIMALSLGLMLIIPALYSEQSTIYDNQEFIRFLPEIVVLFGAMIVMYLTGLYDDLIGVGYGVKFIAQIIAAVMLVEAGDYIVDYQHLFGIGTTTMAMGKIISGFFLVYMVNAMNLIDGLDGLAAGLGVIALIFYGIALYLEGQFLFSLISWIGASTVAVFWIFNVFGSRRHKTKIFMGDVGSLTIGLLIGFLAICAARVPRAQSAWQIQSLVIALSPMVIPVLDVIRVFCVRIMNKKSPFLPDKRHIHHLMLQAGMPKGAVVGWILFAQICLIFLNLWISEFGSINAVLGTDLVLYAIALGCLMATPVYRNKVHLKPNRKQ